jgi:hypothetical protein
MPLEGAVHVDGNGPKRFSVQRKMAIVARLLRGEPLELPAGAGWQFDGQHAIDPRPVERDTSATRHAVNQ